MDARTKKILFIILGIIVIAVAIVGGYFLFNKKIGTIYVPPTEHTAPTDEATNDPILPNLKLPSGFSISYYTKDVPGARVMLMSGLGMFVSQTKEGKISLLKDTNNDGVVDLIKTLVAGLKNPHGLEMQCEGDSCALYVAESNALSMYDVDINTGDLGAKTKLVDLPSAPTDRHSTRTLLFLPNTKNPDAMADEILISVGSSCNVCNETTQRGKILVYNLITKTLTEYSKGLRNAVFMRQNPVDGKIFATEMGRDGLGDDIPPDEINIIEKDKNYGWPICYGKNIHDTDFDKNTYIRNPCMEPLETQSFVDLQAHSAPLGLAFIPEEGWSENYWYDLLVAYHGSWNRTDPTGYKIVRLKIDAKGNYSGTEDFITGWLTADGKKLGRPVDILTQPGGVMYISDDEAGVIYRVVQK